ncbi:Two-component response regulator-like protein [Morus notabilis]|uniref:Two-component response regulator-like protein n=1 Tax=Morus notabilis TaxID=981085 RepID=W9SAL3_9ROSA|nr:two-component response regulator-like PRR37 [Morus notabilis]EXC33207.1 Two-component response regulator-like protein [Morus notabilis]
MCFEQKEVSNGVVDEEQRLGTPEEDESRINISQDVSNGLRGAIQVADGSAVLQSLPQGPVVCWERFLPIRSLKVLLVENDDSTRHVVSALLRNCSYEVNVVSNGLQAWKILEDPNNHTDIVLTEVVMPVLSGIALLCKIMSHKSLKNIPVIMMSSHDSMGIVFKCLSKGAVDFLVKPIRKNELKNLWQHVWRRCHSSSGSGSESGTQTRKYAKSKSNDESDNNSASSEEQSQDNGSTGLCIRGGSDHGSGTQNSRAAEVHSPTPMSPGGQWADTPDSTCAQVIHTKPEKCSNRWVHSTETKECQELGKQFVSKDVEVGVNGKPDLQCEYQQKLSFPSTSKRQNKLPEVDSQQREVDHNGENLYSSPNVNCNKPQCEGRIFGTPSGTSDGLQIKGNSDSGELPSLELTLKRLRGSGDVGSATLDDCNVLRHSDLSAFSKYNTPSSANQDPTGNVGSCSPFGSSSVAPNTGHNFPSHSNSTPPNQQSNGSSNNNDLASTNKYVAPKPEAFNDKPESTSGFKSSHSSAFQPVQSGCICLAPQVPLGKTDDGEVDPVQAPAKGSYKQVQVQHHHHHHHHYHHHVHNLQQHMLQAEHDDLSLKNMAASAQQCGSSNVFGGPVESHTRNYSVNGSASGSNHGSNGQNGSSTALNAGLTNVESDNGVIGNSGGDGISRRNSGIGVDENRVAQREAALTKFRQKRKERCFEKRVRYHSRKKLAEQRPRIRGQFVRQIVSDTKAGEDCESEDLKSRDNSGTSML